LKTKEIPNSDFHCMQKEKLSNSSKIKFQYHTRELRSGIQIQKIKIPMEQAKLLTQDAK